MLPQPYKILGANERQRYKSPPIEQNSYAQRRQDEIDRMKSDIRKRMEDRKKRELEKQARKTKKKEAPHEKLIVSIKNPKVDRLFMNDAATQTTKETPKPICLTCLAPFQDPKIEKMLKNEDEFEPPQLETFEYDSSGYYFDPSTQLYFDPRSEHFYDLDKKQWMFWYSKYSMYFPCDGGNFRMKKMIQDAEREKLIGPLALALKEREKPNLNEDKVNLFVYSCYAMIFLK